MKQQLLNLFKEHALSNQEEVNQLWLDCKKSETVFLEEVKSCFGLVPSVGFTYLVGLHEFSVWFGVVVTNPSEGA